TVEDATGRRAEGWGETPLSVQWVWPSRLAYEERHQALRSLCVRIAEAWSANAGRAGHPMELGYHFIEHVLTEVASRFNAGERAGAEPVPWLGTLVCNSPFDLALHDAYGMLHGLSSFDTYNKRYMSWDLSHYLAPAPDSAVSFEGRYPQDFLVRPRPETI